MVDLKIFLSGAHGTAAVLPVENRGYVVRGKAATVRGHAGPSVVGADATKFPHALWVGDLPSLQSFVGFLAIVLAPPLYLCAMACWVLGAAAARGSRFVSWSSTDPSLGALDRTLGANAVRNEAFVGVPVAAGSSDRVVPLSGVARRNAGWMLGGLRHTAKGAINVALRTGATHGSTLRNVSIPARFASRVETLAIFFSGKSFGHGPHTLTVMRSV